MQHRSWLGSGVTRLTTIDRPDFRGLMGTLNGRFECPMKTLRMTFCPTPNGCEAVSAQGWLSLVEARVSCSLTMGSPTLVVQVSST